MESETITNDINRKHRGNLRKTREIFNKWKDGSVVTELEKLAQEYPWAKDFADKAREFYASDEWQTVLGKLENEDAYFRRDFFAGHNAYLTQILLEQDIYTQGSQKEPYMKIIFDEGELLYQRIDSFKKIRMENISVAYEVRCLGGESLSESDFSVLAEAVTYAMPVSPNVLLDLDVKLENDGCHLHLNLDDGLEE